MTLLMLVGLGSCSDDARNLLNTVPADANFVAVVNAEELLDRVDFKNKDGKPSFNPEMTSLLKNIGIDDTALRKFADGIELTDKVFAMFSYQTEVYITFTVNNPEDFRKWMKSACGYEFADEGKGFYRLSTGEMVMKDNQVWSTAGPGMETKTVENFLALEGDKRFSEKYPEASGDMFESGKLLSAFLNIDEALSLTRKMGMLEASSQAQLGLGMLFKDAAYLTLDCDLSDKDAECHLRVFNKEEKPAEFLIPMSKISTSSMNKINNEAMFVGAVGVSPELVKMLISLVDKYAPAMGVDSRMLNDMISSLQGTSAVSVDENKVIATVGFTSTEAATKAGQFFGTMNSNTRISTAGNFLVIREGDDRPAGSAPKGFGDAYAALSINYASPAMSKMADMDMSQLGRLVISLCPDGKGVQLKSEWQVKDPVNTLLRFANIMVKENNTRMNSYGAYDEPDDSFIEPDSDESQEISYNN